MRATETQRLFEGLKAGAPPKSTCTATQSAQSAFTGESVLASARAPRASKSSLELACALSMFCIANSLLHGRPTAVHVASHVLPRPAQNQPEVGGAAGGGAAGGGGGECNGQMQLVMVPPLQIWLLTLFCVVSKL